MNKGIFSGFGKFLKISILVFLLIIHPLTYIGIALLWVWKMPKNKFLRIALTIVFIIVLIGNNADSDSKKHNNDYIASETKEDSGETDESDIEDETSDKKEQVKLSVTEKVIYDKHNIIIKVMEVSEKLTSTDFVFYIENNSDLNISICAHSYAVNGIMTNNNIYDMSTDVVSGKKANTVLSINNSFLTENGIEDLKTLDILFWMYDNDKHFKEYETEIIHIATNLDDGKKQTLAGETIYDKDGVVIDFLYANGDEHTFLLTNKTKGYFDFDVENITINDYTSSDIDYDLMGNEIFNGFQTVFTIDPDNEFMELNSIEKIETIEFTLNIRPLGDHFNDFSTDTVLLKIK